MLGQSDLSGYADVRNSAALNNAQLDYGQSQQAQAAQAAAQSAARPAGLLAMAIQEGQVTTASIAMAASRLEDVANRIYGEGPGYAQKGEANGNAPSPSHMAALAMTVEGQRAQLERLMNAVARLENL